MGKYKDYWFCYFETGPSSVAQVKPELAIWRWLVYDNPALDSQGLELKVQTIVPWLRGYCEQK